MDHKGLEVSLCLGFPCWCLKCCRFPLLPTRLRVPHSSAPPPPRPSHTHFKAAHLPRQESWSTLINAFSSVGTHYHSWGEFQWTCLVSPSFLFFINKMPQRKRRYWLGASPWDDQSPGLEELTNILLMPDAHWCIVLPYILHIISLTKGTLTVDRFLMVIFRYTHTVVLVVYILGRWLI